MKKFMIALIALLAWFAVIGQYVLILKGGKGTTAEITVRFFSFFTILTNALVAFSFTVLLFREKSFWAKPSTLTAIAVYILVVGAVYNTVLRFIWEPQGWQKLVDELLHSAVPLLVQAYWWIWVPKGTLGWKNVFPWLIYPAAYCVWIMVRGTFAHEYPYPFVDVNVLGAGKVALNCVLLCGVFLGLFFLYAGIDKWRGKTVGSK